jgi:hypothetical protein
VEGDVDVFVLLIVTAFFAAFVVAATANGGPLRASVRTRYSSASSVPMPCFAAGHERRSILRRDEDRRGFCTADGRFPWPPGGVSHGSTTRPRCRTVILR